MDEVQEDDGYSDDDLDALPADAFHELQENAIRSTQQPKTTRNAFPPAITRISTKSTGNVIGGFGRLPFAGIRSQQGHAPVHSEPPSSDYGDFDHEMLDGEIYDAAEDSAFPISSNNLALASRVGDSTQREGWRQLRYGAPAQHRGYEGQHQSHKISDVETQNRTIVQNINYNSHQSHGMLVSQAGEDAESLRAQIQELCREREALQKAAESAKANASSKAGEIAIVRANQTKLERESEKRLAALQKVHTEEAARQKMEVDKARAERQQIETQKRFLENELAHETERIKSLQRAIKSGGGKTALMEVTAKPLTPKKSIALFGDGFDDDEIQIASPSKLPVRSKPASPRAGSKRKRPIEGSPSKPLQLSQKGKEDSSDRLVNGRGPVIEPQSDLSTTPQVRDQRFQFTQKVLNHRIKHGEPRSFEALAAHAFPSDPRKALSSLLLDKLSALSIKTEIENFYSALSLIIISLWQQCISERFYQPVHLLLDLVKFILLTSPPDTSQALTNDLVLLAQNTADIIIIPRIKQTIPSVQADNIDPRECLEILHLMAYNLYRTDDITRFWRRMRFDFTGMLLNILQPIEEMHITLSLLRTSVLVTSFAMRVPPGDGDQGKSETWILYLLSRWLIDVRRSPEGEQPYDVIEICQIRQQVLSLMEAMCDNAHGGEALAKDPVVIGRLVLLINEELNSLYDFQYGHEHRSELVNTALRLLYYVMTTYPDLINLQEKLREISGGQHKYLIVLSRLAFSEGFHEQGIEDDVVECATEMLESLITPEEGESLLEAFGSARK